jgi:hypothetical protein
LTPLDVHRPVHQLVALAGGQLALEGRQLLLQLARLLQHGADARRHLARGHTQGARHAAERGLHALHIGQRVQAGHGLDAAHAGGHAAFANDGEKADVAGALHMGAAAELAAGADVEHAHGLAVFLAEQHHGAGLLGRLDVHHARLGRHVGITISALTRSSISRIWRR